MRATDRWAIDEQGIPSLRLMESAGEALARVVEEAAGGGSIAIVCGKGNNGGDGLVAARLLADWGHRVSVVMLAAEAELSADTAANLARLPESVGRIEAAAMSAGEIGASLATSGLLVDAILGTGAVGEVRGVSGAAIAALNDSAAPVVACDIPSGVDASSGEIAGTAVEADLTVSFHAAKLGHLIAPGKRASGELVIAEIGIPPGGPDQGSAGVIGEEILASMPRRGADSSKFSNGAVLIIGGSRGLTGAPSLAAQAAVRAGAGYATVGVPASLEPILEAKLTEPMTLALPEPSGEPGFLGADAVEAVLEAAGRAQAVLLGPGLGRGQEAVRLVHGLLTGIEAPMVIDADALNALEGDLAALAARQAPTVLTPHAGELARLLDTESAEISRHRLASARAVAIAAGAIVVLKGDDTIVIGPDDDGPAISDLASPGLATAGTGDVLAGLLTALIARGMDPFAASCAAVRAHARAGQLAAERLGSAESVIASDVIEALAAALVGGVGG